MSNVRVTVEYTNAIKSNCTDWYTIIKADTNHLTFNKNDTRAGYFTVAPLIIETILTFQKPDGTIENKTLRGSIPYPHAKDYYKITINDTLDNGFIKPLSIYVDESYIQKEITISGNTIEWQPGSPWTDNRDNQIYKTAKIGNQVWMTENFNYIAEDSWRNPLVKPIDERKYGRWYTCSSAVNAAPAGWHLPTREEWKILEDFLKQNSLTGLESDGFNGSLAGLYSVGENKYYGLKEYGYYKSTSGNVFPCGTIGCSGIYSGGYSCESYASSIRYIKN